ncbi:hypothetical protein HDU82_008867 [Entophlyctis luteolus]|nr:hypothetical protein HDU82_008867 [Entophlyctis luteolus]
MSTAAAAASTAAAQHSSFKRTVHIPGNHALPPGISNQIAWELSYARAGAGTGADPPRPQPQQPPAHADTLLAPTADAKPLAPPAPQQPSPAALATQRELQTLREWDKNLGGASAVQALAAALYERAANPAAAAAAAAALAVGTSIATHPGNDPAAGGCGGGYISPHVIQMQMLSRMYASTGAAAWGAGRRGKVRVPVGGWPSGVEFGMGMKTFDLKAMDAGAPAQGTNLPHGGGLPSFATAAAAGASAVEAAAGSGDADPAVAAGDLRGPLVANDGASLQLQIRKLEDDPAAAHQQQHYSHEPVPSTDAASGLRPDGNDDEGDTAATDVGINDGKNGTGAEHTSETPDGAVAEQNSRSSDGQLESEGNEGRDLWLEWATALIANANALRAKILDPIKTPTGLHAIHHAPPSPIPSSRPMPHIHDNLHIHRASGAVRPQSANKAKAKLEPIHPLQASNAIPYSVPGPNPPPGPPGSADSIVVTDPAHLPRPYAANRRFHSNPIHPDYLVSSDLPPAVVLHQQHQQDTQSLLQYAPHLLNLNAPGGGGASDFPQVYHRESVYMSEFSNRMQIPAQYVAAFNTAARVNGRPLARATSGIIANQQQQPQLSPGQAFDDALLSAASLKRRGGFPAKGAPPILGPLVGSSKVLTAADWQGFQTVERAGLSAPSAAPLLLSGLSGRDGGELYHGVPPCLGPEAVANHWNALLTLPGPVGRRGWNHVGRDHLANFHQGVAPVTNYAYR